MCIGLVMLASYRMLDGCEGKNDVTLLNRRDVFR